MPSLSDAQHSSHKKNTNNDRRRAMLNSHALYAGHNRYGIPDLLNDSPKQLPAGLCPFTKRIRSQRLDNYWLHFFLDDYRFEVVWNRPFRMLRALQKRNRPVLTPDFSLYESSPLAMQLWNVYRSRWCGAFWQHHGLTVVPTVCWSTYPSFEFCFLGIPKGSLVAISAQGVKLNEPLEHQFFMAGFDEMVAQIDPRVVLAYGRLPAGCHSRAEIIEYPTDWHIIRQRLMNGSPKSNERT